MDNMHTIPVQERNLSLVSDKDKTISMPVIESEETQNTDTSKDKKVPKSPRKDRSSAKYSEKDFLALPRGKQLSLAQKYWGGKVEDFDDGTFQFSYTHFSKLCQNLGFIKGVYDPNTSSQGSSPSSTISDKVFISRGRRNDTIEKKYTFSKDTIAMIDSLLGDLCNVEKSKALDAILSVVLSEKLALKAEGKFGVFYPSSGEEKIL